MEQRIKKILTRNNSQSGVTLLLSILVLSALMAISFSLATIIFIEVRTSGDLVRTEGAIFGADAVSEQVLFKVKRKITDSNFFSTPTIDLKNNVKVQKPDESTVTTPVINDMIQTSSKTFGTAKMYEMFSTSSPTSGSGFSKLEIENNGSDNVRVYMCQFNPDGTYGTGTYDEEPCTNATSQQYWIESIGSVIQDSRNKYTEVINGIPQSWFLDPNQVQRLLLINPTGANVLPIKIQAFLWDGSAYVPKSLPLVGEIRVPIKAENSGAVRRIQLIIPNE